MIAKSRTKIILNARYFDMKKVDDFLLLFREETPRISIFLKDGSSINADVISISEFNENINDRRHNKPVVTYNTINCNTKE